MANLKLLKDESKVWDKPEDLFKARIMQKFSLNTDFSLVYVRTYFIQ